MDKIELTSFDLDTKEISPRLPVYKVFIGGKSAVGKTSLLRRYRDGDFSITQTATLGVDFGTLPTVERDGVTFKVQLWDTSGEDRFNRFVTDTIIQNIHVMVYVFALNESASLDGLEEWIDRVQDQVLFQRILVGNKSDLESERQVFQEEIDRHIRAHDMAYFETSAKTGDGVEDLFDCILEHLANETPVDAPDDLLLTPRKKKKRKRRRGLFCCCCKEKYAEL